MNSTKEDFEDKWREMVHWTNEAIKLLEDQTDDGFGVQNQKWLPSESMIPVLAAFLRKIEDDIPSKKQNDCHKKMRYWYWISALANAYSGSSDSRKTSDYSTITEWFKNDKTPMIISSVRDNFPGNIDLYSIEKKNSTNFLAITSLASLKGSKDWTQGLRPTTQTSSSKKKESIEVDHAFPQSIYKNIDVDAQVKQEILTNSKKWIKSHA